jgi:putative ABC transport system permease protein
LEKAPNPNKPSKLALRFFRWFCHPDYLEDIEGDLLERFDKRAKERKSANLQFTLDVIKLFRPGIMKSILGRRRVDQYGMLKAMFTIAWRSAIRQKQFTVLNISGLMIGIATSLMIGLYVYDEVTYDAFHEKGDRIYRVNQPSIWADWDKMSSSTGPNVATALRTDAPEFEQVTRILSLGDQTLTIGSEKQSNAFKETKMYAVEENFTEVFSFKFLNGNPKTVFSNPYSMAITLKSAQRYFGEDIQSDEVMGKTVNLKDYDGSWKVYTINGVMEDVPQKSHLQFDVLVSLKSQSEMMKMHEWKWIWTAFSTYGLVKEGTDMAFLEEKLQAIPPKWAPPTTTRIFNQTFEEFTAGHLWKLELQPLGEIYISGAPSNHSFGPTGNPFYVKIFGAIGLLVLMLSAINFMNLSTARSTNRAKEVGIRKVLGSQRGSLLFQFILESVMFVIVSAILALVLVHMSLDAFNFIADKQITLLPHFSNPYFYGILFSFIILLGMLAGSYPAFYLSAFRPIESLKGKVSGGFKGKALRNGLVVFQFSISIALIICTFFVQKQLAYVTSLDVGFSKDNILQIHNVEQFGFDTEALKTRLSSNPNFTEVSKSFGIPPYVWSGDRYKSSIPESEVVQLSNFRIDEDYLDLLGIAFVSGRNFDPLRSQDKYACVLNESAVRALGWNMDDMQATTPQYVTIASGGEQQFEVLGVVEDFNFNTVKDAIAPLILINHENDNVWDYGAGLSYLSMRLNPETVKNPADLHLVIENLEEELTTIDATVPFEYSFMDQEFENTFRTEQRMGTVLNVFTFMAIFIACIGLFGLAAFSAEQRIKELGIRKVMGAKVSQIILLFSSEFTRLIIVAIIIACPVAWLLVDHWLADFANSTPIDGWVFVLAAFVTFAIAWITIGYQSFRAAIRNPVESLKNE